MNKRIATLTLVVSLLAAANAFAIEGSWTASLSEKNPSRIHMNVSYGSVTQNGDTRNLSEFTNLTLAQINAATTTPVNFELRREAGNVQFEGTFRNGRGAGQFTYTHNPAYLDAVRALGIDVELRHGRRTRSLDEQLLIYALVDVSVPYIKSMMAIGYRTTLEKYLEMRIFDITPEYVREMQSLGFNHLDEQDLITSKIHKVTPAYVREMRAAGWNLSMEQYASSAIHGATPAFAAEMKKLGYGDLSLDDLVGFRIHKVTPDFIHELHTLGYDHIDADDLMAMRIHRVTPEFIRELQAAGYRNVPVEKLVSMRIHGLDGAKLKRLNGE